MTFPGRETRAPRMGHPERRARGRQLPPRLSDRLSPLHPTQHTLKTHPRAEKNLPEVLQERRKTSTPEWGTRRVPVLEGFVFHDALDGKSPGQPFRSCSLFVSLLRRIPAPRRSGREPPAICREGGKRVTMAKICFGTNTSKGPSSSGGRPRAGQQLRDPLPISVLGDRAQRWHPFPERTGPGRRSRLGSLLP